MAKVCNETKKKTPWMLRILGASHLSIDRFILIIITEVWTALLPRQVSVEVMEFPPLPPSPVEEADEESCSDVGQGAMMTPPKSKSHNRTMEYRPRVPPHRVPPVIDPKEQASLNTRSMDAGYARGRRTPTTSNSRREVSWKYSVIVFKDVFLLRFFYIFLPDIFLICHN